MKEVSKQFSNIISYNRINWFAKIVV